MNLDKKVKEIIAIQLGIDADALTTDAKLMDDLGTDSLDTVELRMAFKDEFKIEIPDEDTEKLYSVGSTINYLRSRVV